jgi:hypothetical protein
VQPHAAILYFQLFFLFGIYLAETLAGVLTHSKKKCNITHTSPTNMQMAPTAMPMSPASPFVSAVSNWNFIKGYQAKDANNNLKNPIIQ